MGPSNPASWPKSEMFVRGLISKIGVAVAFLDPDRLLRKLFRAFYIVGIKLLRIHVIVRRWSSRWHRLVSCAQPPTGLRDVDRRCSPARSVTSARAAKRANWIRFLVSAVIIAKKRYEMNLPLQPPLYTEYRSSINASHGTGCHERAEELLRSWRFLVNIVDLGSDLRREIRFRARRQTGCQRGIDMTLTAQGCPEHVNISMQVKSRLEQLPGIRNAAVNVVWTPALDS